MINKNKREIPRHVEERVMIGLMPFRMVIKLLPIYIGTIVLTMMFLSPISSMIGVLVLGSITYLYCEISYKETGIEILKGILRYKKEGDIHFERSCVIRDEVDRITINKIKKRNIK